MKVRKTGKRAEFDHLWAQLNKLQADLAATRGALADLGVDVDGALMRVSLWRVLGYADIDDASTAGKLATTSAVPVSFGGLVQQLPPTDDFWDLSGETDTGEDEYRAYWLYVSAAGVASIEAGESAATEEAALEALPARDPGLIPVGVYIAGPQCDFDAAGGLKSQGRVHHGDPVGVVITHTAPPALTSEQVELVAP